MSKINKESHAPSSALASQEKSVDETEEDDMPYNGNLGKEFTDLKQKVEDLCRGVGFDPDADLTGANTDGTSTKPKASTFGKSLFF